MTKKPEAVIEKPARMIWNPCRCLNLCHSRASGNLDWSHASEIPIRRTVAEAGIFRSILMIPWNSALTPRMKSFWGVLLVVYG